mmetsp:Transcript_10737/g.33104  ORF Transcript_10737/g.33104 Transcript_10737/m.33104 type:complete len:255 (-) Transcript_10737:1971-2735(-)
MLRYCAPLQRSRGGGPRGEGGRSPGGLMRRLLLALGAGVLVVVVLRPAPVRTAIRFNVSADVRPHGWLRSPPPPPTRDAEERRSLTQPMPPRAPARRRGGYTFWSTDYHIAPIADLVDVFSSLCQKEGVCMKVEENSFSGACGRTFGGRKPSCARGLRVINQINGFELCPRPHALRRQFFDAYKGPSSPLQHVDAFVCNHPPAMCELYMPFNKSMIVLATVNLEFSRESPERWNEWLQSLRAIASDRCVAVARS